MRQDLATTSEPRRVAKKLVAHLFEAIEEHPAWRALASEDADSQAAMKWAAAFLGDKLALSDDGLADLFDELAMVAGSLNSLI